MTKGKELMNRFIELLSKDNKDTLASLMDGFKDLNELIYNDFIESNKDFLNEIKKEIQIHNKEESIANFMMSLTKRDGFIKKLGLWNDYLEWVEEDTKKNFFEEFGNKIQLERFIKEEYEKKEESL